MWWTNVIIALCFLQAPLLTDANRRSIRHRRQAVASSYGSNLPSGYNYQPNTNYYNPNQNNNQPTNNFYSNSLGSSNVPTGLNNQQQQQPQLQPQQPQQPQPNAYNPSGQPWSNPVQQGANLYSPTGTNTNLNPTGQGSINPVPSASASGSGSFYPSSNGQIPYSMNNNNNNQMLTNRDLYSQPSLPNTNTNNNNNNNNPLQNGYGNNNPWANTNPNTNVYNSNQGSSNYNSPNLYPTYNNDVTRMVLSLGLLFICLIITI